MGVCAKSIAQCTAQIASWRLAKKGRSAASAGAHQEREWKLTNGMHSPLQCGSLTALVRVRLVALVDVRNRCHVSHLQVPMRFPAAASLQVPTLGL